MRPTRLTPAVQKRICESLAKGNYLKTAASENRLTYDSVNNWRKRGEAELRRLEASDDAKPIKSEAIYLKFFLATEGALAEWETSALDQMERACEDDPRALIEVLKWKLARGVARERWGRDTREVDAGDAGDSRGAVIEAVDAMTNTEPLPGE